MQRNYTGNAARDRRMSVSYAGDTEVPKWQTGWTCPREASLHGNGTCEIYPNEKYRFWDIIHTKMQLKDITHYVNCVWYS